MARRLLGADNAATVLNTQDTEEEPVTQVWWLFTRIHTPRDITHTHTNKHYHLPVLHVYNTSTFLFSVLSSDTWPVSFLSHELWLSFIYC